MDSPCLECSDAVIEGREHPRCRTPGCVCDCRGPALDLDDPDARLEVATLLRSMTRQDFVDPNTPAGVYVNDLIQNFARSEMRILMGLREPGKPEGPPPLSDEEILAVRTLLESGLTTEEAEACRAALPAASILAPTLEEMRQQLSKLLQARPAPAPQTSAPPRAAPVHSGPSPETRPTTPQAPQARGARPMIQMPRGSALALATASDAGRAQLIAARTPPLVEGESGASSE